MLRMGKKYKLTFHTLNDIDTQMACFITNFFAMSRLFARSLFKIGYGKGEMLSQTADPVQRAAEELVRSINPNAVKFVKEQFK